MYQNLLVYISQTQTYWHNYIPTQTELMNRCPWQAGWYQGGKAERSVFADCLTFNIFSWCTENQHHLILSTYGRKWHGNAQHTRACSQMDLPGKPFIAKFLTICYFSARMYHYPISCWLIPAMSSHRNIHCSKGNGLTQSWLNAQNCS